jgi:hypothetical protein
MEYSVQDTASLDPHPFRFGSRSRVGLSILASLALVLSLSVGLTVWVLLSPVTALAQAKGPHMTCGSCPEGFAKTGVTTDPAICKDGDPTVVQCVPLGSPMLSVCGSCPEGYQEVGSSNVPDRCGDQEGGRMTQCQLPKMDQGLPDPNKGGVFCPPNCAGELPTPGQGAIPPPPKFLPPPPESK